MEDIKKRYIGWPHIDDYVNRVSFEMYKDNFRPDYIVGLSRGGLIPAVLMSHRLDIPMKALKVSLRDHTDDNDHNWTMAEDAQAGAKILVLDDINDTGATLNWIVNDWKLSQTQDNVKFAVLFDNLSSGFCREIDYCALEINKAENNEWIVFPWEH
jgi:hypoxanthine phosphoribosyltransferase